MSKANDATRIAFRKGYRVTEDGTVVNALGRARVVQIKNPDTDPRCVFNVGIGDGQRFPVMVHKLQAYQKFGEAMFAPGILVRHLDEDSLNNRPGNIELGTPVDNAMDRSDSARQLHAQNGLRGRGKIDETTWATIAEDHAAGMGYKLLRKKYGVSLGTLSYRLSQNAAYRLLEHRGPPSPP